MKYNEPLLAFTFNFDLRRYNTVSTLEEAFGVGPEGAASIILKNPTLLGLNVEPTLRSYIRLFMKLPPSGTSEARAVKLARYHLARVLVPRLQLLESNGQAGMFTDALELTAHTDAEFCKAAGVKRKEYAAQVATFEERYLEITEMPQHEMDAKVRKLWNKRYPALDDLTLAAAVESKARAYTRPLISST